ncbi:MAG: ribosomal protein S18-alanine N-acetyltransferase [Lachnospiraceae bacterium]|nr:ribosomal protein S18-alanine N-acetyltransferase [Lachnospiraceae bacterium]
MIQKMQPCDVKEVAAIEKEIFSMPWSSAGFAEALKREENLYLVAKEDGAVVGYCGYYGALDEGEIPNVAVKKEYRNRGIAAEMLKQLISEAKERGITRLILEVRKSNEPAISLYEKLGFIHVGIRKNFYENPVEDALIMDYHM